LDPAEAPANELAALYHERWGIETALDEFKTELQGAHIVLRNVSSYTLRKKGQCPLQPGVFTPLVGILK
jgi:hypothetical protein